MINLETFIKEKKFIVPIINGNFQINRKKYQTDNVSGWYEVSISSNNVKIINSIIIEIQNSCYYKIIKGYTYHNNIIFQNFDVAKRKLNKEIMMPLNFNNLPTFSPVEAIIWEDKKLYLYKTNYLDFSCFNLSSIFKQGNSIKEIKGLTPELKTLYLFHELENQKLIEQQQQIKKKKELEEFKKTLQGRLLLIFNQVNANIVDYSHEGDKIIVNWELKSSGNKYNSIINANTFQVIEAGYCMSGEDKKHTAISMVKLAEDYEERDLIYKTRS